MNTHAYGINNAGQIVGDFTSAGPGIQSFGFVRDALGSFTPFSVPGQLLEGVSEGINDDGVIVGTYTAGGHDHGFERDAAGNVTTINVPGASDTYLNGINNAGQIVGFSSIGSFVRDAAGNYTMIGVPGTSATFFAYGINNAGQIVGSVSTASTSQSFVRDAAGNIRTFSIPGASSTDARGINDAGTILGDFQTPSSSQGFLLDAIGNLTVLNLPVVPGGLSFFHGVNNEDQIVAYWGPGVSFLGTPVPEPSTMVMSAFGLIAVLGVFYRHRRSNSP
jgi:YD repeat-containing protein